MPDGLTVADIMTREVITLAEDDTLADARRCMDRGRVRHLPVVRGRCLVGLVTHRDILAASFSLFAQVSAREERRVFSQIPVCDLMHDAVSVSPETSVLDAARILLENKFGCLPVVGSNGDLLGIVTEADYLRLAAHLLEAIQA